MASLAKHKKRRRQMRDEKIAKKRATKTRIRDRKQKESGALLLS